MKGEPAKISTTLRVGGLRVGPTLTLSRRPKYLRFVAVGEDFEQLDALDLLEDEPKPHEKIYAAVLVERGSLHVDGKRNGKRFAEWLDTADYELLAEQPSDEVLRDAAKWQAWAISQNEKQAG